MINITMKSDDINSSKVVSIEIVLSRRKIRLKKRILLIIGLASIMMLLAGCTEMNQPITAESTGFWNAVYRLSIITG